MMSVQAPSTALPIATATPSESTKSGGNSESSFGAVLSQQMKTASSDGQPPSHGTTTATKKNGASDNDVESPAVIDSALLAAANPDLAAFVANLLQTARPATTTTTDSPTDKSAIQEDALASTSPGAHDIPVSVTNGHIDIVTPNATPLPIGESVSGIAASHHFAQLLTQQKPAAAPTHTAQVLSLQASATNGGHELTALKIDKLAEKIAINAQEQGDSLLQPAADQPIILNTATTPTLALAAVAPHEQTYEKLTQRVGTSAWEQSVGDKVVWMVAGGKQTAELHLNPPELGPLRIVISVNQDQASANFVTSHPEVKHAIESAMPKLQQMMGDAGVQLTGFSVNAQASNQSQNFAQAKSGGSRASSTPANPDAVNVASVPTTTLTSTTNIGLVDTFV